MTNEENTIVYTVVPVVSYAVRRSDNPPNCNSIAEVIGTYDDEATAFAVADAMANADRKNLSIGSHNMRVQNAPPLTSPSVEAMVEAISDNGEREKYVHHTSEPVGFRRPVYDPKPALTEELEVQGNAAHTNGLDDATDTAY